MVGRRWPESGEHHRIASRLKDRAKPDGDRLCHGDFHPMNILGDVSQPVIIDWPDARRGDPAADVCRSYLLMRSHAAEIAAIYLNATKGFRYRVRGRWKGDANNLAATSAWRYFRYR